MDTHDQLECQASEFWFLSWSRDRLLLEQWRRERARLITSAGAPDHAGTRSETWQESRRHPMAYFRQGRRKQWQPQIVLESAEVRERMWEALIFMTRHASTQRDKLVLLLLRHTGARLHEILGMTIGGYRKAADPLRAFVVNKPTGCATR